MSHSTIVMLYAVYANIISIGGYPVTQ